MNARLITRCGCERVLSVPSPAPPYIDIPLRQIEAGIRPWLSEGNHLRYYPPRHGLARRRFKLDPKSGYSEYWYDEVIEFDEKGVSNDLSDREST